MSVLESSYIYPINLENWVNYYLTNNWHESFTIQMGGNHFDEFRELARILTILIEFEWGMQILLSAYSLQGIADTKSGSQRFHLNCIHRLAVRRQNK
jgi:hypothetical protein